MNYARAIRIVRGARGWTQKQLAEKSNSTSSTISHIESDKYSPTEDLLEDIANALEIPSALLRVLSFPRADIHYIGPELAKTILANLMWDNLPKGGHAVES